MIEAYVIHLLILVCIYAVLALSLQLAMGFGGLLNLGHIGFFCIGAYASALLVLAGVPFAAALLAAGIISAFFGVLLAIPTHRLKGDYLALATLGFSFVVYAVAVNWTDVTRGPLGIPGIPRPEIGGILFSDNGLFLVLSAVIAAFSFLFLRRLTRSSFGRALQAVRDNELAAQAIGKDSFQLKSKALGISAFFAGLSGSLFAHYITFIDPSSFSIMQLIPVLSIVIVGGLASLEGTLLATVVLILLPEPLRFIGFPSSVVGPMRQLLYALILLVILRYRPKGFLGKIELDAH